MHESIQGYPPHTSTSVTGVNEPAAAIKVPHCITPLIHLNSSNTFLMLQLYSDIALRHWLVLISPTLNPKHTYKWAYYKTEIIIAKLSTANCGTGVLRY